MSIHVIRIVSGVLRSGFTGRGIGVDTTIGVAALLDLTTRRPRIVTPSNFFNFGRAAPHDFGCKAAPSNGNRLFGTIGENASERLV